MVQRMTAPTKNNLRLAALFCCAVSLYDLLFVATGLVGVAEPIIGYSFPVPFVDFLVFHAGARAFFEGKLAIVYDTTAFTQFQNTLYRAFIHVHWPSNIVLAYRPFLYPPMWLIALLPFGAMPPAVSAIVFLIVTGTLCAIALRLAGLRTEAVFAILASPASAWVVVAGQNSYLSVALLYGGMALLEKRPVLAGTILGLLVYKPQLWILVPLALLMSRGWRPLFAMAATVALLSLVSYVLFGQDFWLDFIASTRHLASPEVAAERYAYYQNMMETISAASTRLGLGDTPSAALQAAGALLALGAVIWAFARYPARLERLAILVAATFLVSPSILTYDMFLLAPAAALLFLHPSPAGYLPGERIVYGAIWLLPAVSPPLNYFGIHLTPLVVLLFGLIAVIRLHRTSEVELPIAATAR